MGGDEPKVTLGVGGMTRKELPTCLMTPGGRARPGVTRTVQAVFGYRLATPAEVVAASWWKEGTTHLPDVPWKCVTPSCQGM